MNSNMTIGKAGLDLIKAKEGFSATWYICQAGKTTIGWGHVKEFGDSFKTIDKAKGEELLQWDCREAIAGIKKHVTCNVSQNRFDALVVFVFNIGVARFTTSTVLKELNKGNVQAAADAFGRWNKITNEDGVKEVSRGLVKRRAEERELFLK